MFCVNGTTAKSSAYLTSVNMEFDRGRTTIYGDYHGNCDIYYLHRHARSCEEARKCADYIRRNRHRMRYAEFRAQGFCTSTGVVEAGCKLAIGTRLKRSGMHWTVRGANAIIALRCCKLSARFEDFWERRAQTKAA